MLELYNEHTTTQAQTQTHGTHLIYQAVVAMQYNNNAIFEFNMQTLYKTIW